MLLINLVKKKKTVAKKSNKSSGKVNDVSKPGETPASSNARPTIAGHQPSIKNDPMVASSSSDNDESSKDGNKRQSYLNKTKIKLSPISEELKSDNKNEEEGKPKEKSETEDQPEAEKNEEKKSEEEKTTSANSESAAIDAIAKTADSKKAESKQAEEEQKHKEYVEGLVKSGKYRLPIVEGGHKGSAERIVSWIFLLLLLASAGVYIAIDAGYIDIGFGLPFEFIQD